MINFNNILEKILECIFSNYLNTICVVVFLISSLITWRFINLFKKELLLLLSFVTIAGFVIPTNISVFFIFFGINLLFNYSYYHLYDFLYYIVFDKNKDIIKTVNSVIRLLYVWLLILEIKILLFVNHITYKIAIQELCGALKLFGFSFIVACVLIVFLIYKSLFVNFKQDQVDSINRVVEDLKYIILIQSLYYALSYFDVAKFSLYISIFSSLIFLLLRFLSYVIVEHLTLSQQHLKQENLIVLLNLALFVFDSFEYFNIIDLAILYTTIIIIDSRLSIIVNNFGFIIIFKTILCILVYLILTNLISYLLQTRLEKQLISLNRFAGNSKDRFNNNRIGTIINTIKIITTSIVGFCLLWIVLTQIIHLSIGLQSIGWLAGGLAFGVQTLVKDYVSGFFNLLEGTLNIGDVVKVSGVNGVIENITMRLVKIRDFDGVLHIIPFHKIDLVTSSSKNYIYMVSTIVIDSSTKQDDIEKALQQANILFSQHCKINQIHLSDRGEIIGLTDFINGSGMKYEVRFKISPPTGLKVLRAMYNRILKSILDEENIRLFTILPFNSIDSNSLCSK